MGETIYLRMRNRIQVYPNESVTIGQVAMIVTEDQLKEQVEQLVVRQVNMSDRNIVIVDVMEVIQKMRTNELDAEIQTIGPSQTIIDVVYKRSSYSFPLFVTVWFLLFIGAALAIMNFHEDVSMQVVHQKIFFLLTGVKDDQPLLLQIPYSLGLGIGMILFFNHLFRKRINEEPSPLEVEMFNYQQDLDRYVIMNESKESIKNIDDR